MGFYGNITNTSKTTFQFDKIYANRQIMDGSCEHDGIFVGRYVLIEYDSELDKNYYDKTKYLINYPVNSNYYTIYDGVYNGISCGDSSEDRYYYTFGGPLGAPLNKAEIDESKVFYIDINKRFSVINDSRSLFIKAYQNGDYSEITQREFEEYASIQSLDGIILTKDWILNNNLLYAYIANNKAYFDDPNSVFENVDDFVVAIVLPGMQYEFNTTPEFWTIQNNPITVTQGNVVYYQQLKNASNSSLYITNYSLDFSQYHSQRGYDSTVWQKVIQNGREKYVMIAELNTVVPTFGLTADPPTLVPVNPHWGADSTNVYYDLHWQPAWGFRVKSSNNTLKLPRIRPNGKLEIADITQLNSQYPNYDVRVDDIYYPSDVWMSWKHVFENNTLENDNEKMTLYYNMATNKWDATESKLPAAIYFNKKGFDSSKIFYSSDLLDSENPKTYNSVVASSGWKDEDNISVTPTGQSGNSYNLHDGTANLEPAVDTQEMSIMLPSIGNTMAKIWDLIYGGRDTNSKIRQTGYRNKDIHWENARGETARRGLRLTGQYGDEYNTAEVDTLAGAINTAHDLLGMIISTNTASELSNPDNLDYNRIYYDSTNKVYKRKCKKYIFDELDEDAYHFDPENNHDNITQEKIDQGIYYVYENGEYVLAEGEYDSNTQYFLRNVKTQYEEIEKTIINFPYELNGNVYQWHQDYLGENNPVPIANPTDRLLLSDYIKDEEYQEGKDYYTVAETPIHLISGYEPNMYWYKEVDPDTQQTRFLLDTSSEDERRQGRVYYTFDPDNMIEVTSAGYQNIYVPGKYSFKYYDASGKLNYIEDKTSNMTYNNISSSSLYIDPVTHEKPYYTLKNTRIVNPDGTYSYYILDVDYDPVTLDSNTYIPGFYYIDGANGKELCYDPYDEDEKYFLRISHYQKIESAEQWAVEEDMRFSPSQLALYQNQTYFLKEVNEMGELIGFLEITQASFLSDPDILNKKIYAFGYKENQNQKPPFASLDTVIARNDIIVRQDAFYEPNMYHYKTANGSYLLDTNPSKTHDNYYTIRPTKLNLDLENTYTYYQPNKYFEKIDDESEYTLVENNSYNNETLYEEKELYVISDSRGILPAGTKWNPNALRIPEGVVLGTRRETSILVPFEGYSTDTGTINGTILKLAQLIEPNDKLTRNQNTINGALNTVKDKIAFFGNFKSRDFMIVDDYGRIRSSGLTTNQILTGENNTEYNKSWLDVKVNGDPENPLISINHTYNQQNNETEETPDLNDFDVSLNSANKITINRPVFDEMGHKVAEAPITYTLPFDYKTIKVNDTAMSAGNTQDTFTITNDEGEYDSVTVSSQEDFNNGTYYIFNNGEYQKASTYQSGVQYYIKKNWIVLEPSGKSVNIKHNTSEIDVTNSGSTNINDLLENQETGRYDVINNTVNIPDWAYDSRGHIIAKKDHSYTLPFGFKYISLADKPVSGDKPDDKRDIEADNTQDTLEIRNSVEKIVAKNVTQNNFGLGTYFILNNENEYEGASTYIENTTYYEDSDDDWITLRSDQANDLLRIGHKVSVIDETDADALDLNDATVNGSVVNTINIPEWSYDTRGHILSKKNKIYTLPSSFKTFVVEGTPLVPANIRDTFTIRNKYYSVGQISENTYNNNQGGIYYISQNNDYVLATTYDSETIYYKKDNWVVLTPDNTHNIIEIGHKEASVNTTERTEPVNIDGTNVTQAVVTSINGGQFSIPDIEYDRTGHFTMLRPHKYQLSNSFGNIKINTKNSISPTSYDDTVTINGDTNWIQIAEDSNNLKTIVISHKNPYSNEEDNITAGLDEDNTLIFGGTFNLLNVTYDSKGHIVSINNDYKLTLPTPSLLVTKVDNNAKPGNVIIGLSLTDNTTGQFTYTPEYLGKLTLGADDDKTPIALGVRYDPVTVTSDNYVAGKYYTKGSNNTYSLCTDENFSAGEYFECVSILYKDTLEDALGNLQARIDYSIAEEVSLRDTAISIALENYYNKNSIDEKFLFDSLIKIRGYTYSEVERNTINENNFDENIYYIYDAQIDYYQKAESYDSSQLHYYLRSLDNNKRLATLSDLNTKDSAVREYIDSKVTFDYLSSVVKEYEEIGNDVVITNDNYSRYYILDNGIYVQAPDANQDKYYEKVDKCLLTSDDGKTYALKTDLTPINNSLSSINSTLNGLGNTYLAQTDFNYENIVNKKADDYKQIDPSNYQPSTYYYQDSEQQWVLDESPIARENVDYFKKTVDGKHILTTDDDYVTESDLPDISGMITADTEFTYEEAIPEHWDRCNPYPTQTDYEADRINYWVSDGEGGYRQCTNDEEYVVQENDQPYYYTYIAGTPEVKVKISDLINKIKHLESLIN